MIMKRLAATVSAVVIAMLGLTVAVDAKTVYLSELTVAVGEDSITTLEKQGYTVLFQGMNLVTEPDSAVYLGYKKGGTAITDIVVSDKKSSTITVGNITYALVSNVSLNQGTDGTPIYLYYTKVDKAGSGLAGIETATITEDSGSLDSLLNDGSTPVLDSDGKLANIEKGLSDGALYLKKIPAQAIKQYISRATLVTGTTRDEALLKVINNGYDCFLDESLGKKSVTYLAYCRTAEKSDALTGLYLADETSAVEGYTVSGTAGDKKLFVRKGDEAPLLDVATYLIFEDSFTLADWSSLYFARLPSTGAKAFMLQDSNYKALLKNNTACSSILSGVSESGASIYGIYCGKATAPKMISASEETTTSQTTTQPITVAEAVEEDITDALIENEKSEEAVSEETTQLETDSMVSSVLGKGNFVAVILLTVAVIAVVVILTILKKRRGQNHNEAV